MENYLLTLISQKFKPHRISIETIRNQLKLACIDLERLAQDVAKTLELSDCQTLSFDDIHERQLAMNIRDNEILAYFDRKQYADNSLPKIRDRVKLTKILSEINKARSFNKQSFQRPFKHTKLSDLCKHENIEAHLKLDVRMSLESRYHFCQKELKDLKSINLKDMTVNKIHSGYYLECIVFSKPIYNCGLSFFVKDRDDQIESVILYNYESKFSNIDPNILMPIGTRLIVKEPYLQTVFTVTSLKEDFNVEKEEEYVIRIESPTDVNVLKFGDNENKAENKTAQLFQTVRQHTDETENSNTPDSYLKRSEAYLELEKYCLAYQDAQKVVQQDPKNMKAYFLMGKANYKMKKFQMAKENFLTCLKLYAEIEHLFTFQTETQNDENIPELKPDYLIWQELAEKSRLELNRTESRISESITGIYDTKALITQYLKNENLHFDIADYESDKIEIADFVNKSKGVRAKEFIAKGTLLVVSKAVSAIIFNNTNYRDNGYFRIYTAENNHDKKDVSMLVSDLAYKMQYDPDLSEKLYSLYAGPNYNREDAHQTKFCIDIMRIENVLAKNGFGVLSYLESIELKKFQNEYIKKLKSLDYNIDMFNPVDLESLNFESETYKELARSQINYDNLYNRRGLWLFPSYFNHACSGNSFYIILGDMMMIYTRRDVSKGEELTINYVSPLLKYSVRKEKFYNTFQFECDCEMCQLDEMDLLRPKREELLGKIIFANNNQSISETIDDANKIRQTYLQRTKFKYQLIYPLDYLALKYRESSMFAESAKCYEQMFDVIKDCNEFLAIASLKEACVDYRKCSEIEKSNSCQTRAAKYFVNLEPFFDIVWEKIQLIW